MSTQSMCLPKIESIFKNKMTVLHLMHSCDSGGSFTCPKSRTDHMFAVFIASIEPRSYLLDF